MPILFDKLSSLYDSKDQPSKHRDPSSISSYSPSHQKQQQRNPSSSSSVDKQNIKGGNKENGGAATTTTTTSAPGNDNNNVDSSDDDGVDHTSLSPEEMQHLMEEIQIITGRVENYLCEFLDVVRAIEEIHRKQKDTASLDERKIIGDELAEGLAEGNAAMLTIQDELKVLRNVGLIQHMRSGTVVGSNKTNVTKKAAAGEEGDGVDQNDPTTTTSDDYDDTSLLTVVDRIRDNQHMHLLNRFLEICTAFHDVQETAELSDQEEMKRWLKIRFTPSSGSTSSSYQHHHTQRCLISDEEAERLSREILQCDDPDRAQKLIFAQQHEIEGKLEAASEAERRQLMMYQSMDILTNQIEIRNDIKRIEKNMNQLNQLFSDMAVLVAHQQPVLESILYNCNRAERHMENGLRQLAEAKVYQRAASSKIRMGAGCCIIA